MSWIACETSGSGCRSSSSRAADRQTPIWLRVVRMALLYFVIRLRYWNTYAVASA